MNYPIRYRGYWIHCNPIAGLFWVERDGFTIYRSEAPEFTAVANCKAQIDAIVGDVP